MAREFGKGYWPCQLEFPRQVKCPAGQALVEGRGVRLLPRTLFCLRCKSRVSVLKTCRNILPFGSEMGHGSTTWRKCQKMYFSPRIFHPGPYPKHYWEHFPQNVRWISNRTQNWTWIIREFILEKSSEHVFEEFISKVSYAQNLTFWVLDGICLHFGSVRFKPNFMLIGQVD
jgi:hypothetical protein